MRVLISSYVCKPGMGSEPEAGYNFVRAAAAKHEVTVLTHTMNLGDLQDALDRADLPPVRIVTLDTPKALRRHVGKLGLGHVDYMWWQLRAWRWMKREQPHFDLIHHATYGTDWMPAAPLALKGIPIVWGNVGGISVVPWRLWRFLSPRGLLKEALRELLTRALRLLTVKLVLRSGALVVARNRETGQYFERAGAPVIVDPRSTALPPLAATASPQSAPGTKRRALFISRLTPWKGPLLAVHTLAALGPEWQLEVFGTGEMEPQIRATAARLGISARVILHGRVPKEQVLDALTSADVLLFPAVHDSSPMPVAEAGRAGCPVVCLDSAGPPLMIEGTTGIAVPLGSNVVAALADAVRRVRRHPPSANWTPARMQESIERWYAAAYQSSL